MLILNKFQNVIRLILFKNIIRVDFLESLPFFDCLCLLLVVAFKVLMDGEHLDNWCDEILIDSWADIEKRDQQIEFDA